MKQDHLKVSDLYVDVEDIPISQTATRRVKKFYVLLDLPDGTQEELRISEEAYNKLKRSK